MTSDGISDKSDRQSAAPSWSRWAYFVMGIGLVTAFVGNVMRSSGKISLVGVGSIINEVGMGVMVVAAIVLLVAYQMRRFSQFRDRSRGEKGDRETGRKASYYLGLSIAVLVFLVAASILLWVPNRWLKIGVVNFQIVMVSIFPVVIVYNRGHLRAFCIAALVPATLQLLGLGVVPIMFSPTRVWSQQIPDDFRLSVGVFWLLLLVIGWCGVVARKLTETPVETPDRLREKRGIGS